MNTHFVTKRLAHMLGCAGLIPFVLLALASWLAHPDWLGVFIKAQLAYGVLTFAFVGGIHWGAALASGHLSAEQTKRVFGWSVVPPLLAWFATMVGGFGFAVLMVGFVAAYHVDKRLYAWYRMPEWAIRLRFVLTCAAVAAIALTVAAANVRG
ncbi:MAG TPA: DUF3429 domain-containing protein [Paucimonas sp.]|nr:DUF3429 domain-containing protein [Paucimonas sp.]